MKFAITALAVASLVHAQNSSTLIPAGISSGCSSFLTNLNADGDLAACVQPLLNATASFSPAASANLTTDDINYTLAEICKTTSGCADATIRTWLSSFYSSCEAELTSTASYNADIRELYDILYVVNPLKDAVCAIDSANQDYCVNEIVAAEKANGTATPSASGVVSASASASASTSGVANNTLLVALAATNNWSPVKFAAENLYITLSAPTSLAKRFLNLITSRADDSASAQSVNFATIVAPNSTTYRTTNLPFLFLQPDMTSAALCTPCTREVMVSYIKWEIRQPYALGLSQSPILGGQSALWSAINSTCGSSYVNAITAEVGNFASSTGNSTSGAEAVWAVPKTAAVGVAVVAGAMAFLA